jgi:hypothetical protein
MCAQKAKVENDLPQIHTNAIHVRRSEEVIGRREGDAGGHAAGPEGIDHSPRRNVKCPNDRVERGDDQPSRVRREGLDSLMR